MKVGRPKERELSNKEFQVLKHIIDKSNAQFQFFEHKDLQKLFRGNSKRQNLSNLYLPSLVKKSVLCVFKRPSRDATGYVKQWRLPDMNYPNMIRNILKEYLKRGQWEEFKDSFLNKQSPDYWVGSLFMEREINVFSPSFLEHCFGLEEYNVPEQPREIYLACLLSDSITLQDKNLYDEYKRIKNSPLTPTEKLIKEKFK